MTECKKIDVEEAMEIGKYSTISEYFQAKAIYDATLENGLLHTDYASALISAIWNVWAAGKAQGIREERAKRRTPKAQR